MKLELAPATIKDADAQRLLAMDGFRSVASRVHTAAQSLGATGQDLKDYVLAHACATVATEIYERTVDRSMSTGGA